MRISASRVGRLVSVRRHDPIQLTGSALLSVVDSLKMQKLMKLMNCTVHRFI